MSSIKYPPRNGGGRFLADTSSLFQIGQGVDLRWARGGWVLEERLKESGMGGKEKETQGESRTGIKKSLKGSHLISWLTWL